MPDSEIASQPFLEQLLAQRAAFLGFLNPEVGPAAAEDILQSCYLKILEKGAGISNEESIVSWFYTVLRHATIDYYRKNATRNRTHDRFSAESPVSYEAELKANVCQCLPGVLATLKAEYRTALHEVDLEGRSVADFARSQGTSPNNASVRLHRARKAAAQRITEVCGACAEHKCLDCTCRKLDV